MKRNDLLSILFAPVLIGTMYLFRSYVLLEPGPTNHLYLVSGCLAVWATAFGHLFLRSDLRGLHIEISWWKRIISLLGGIAGVATFILGMAVTVFAMIIPFTQDVVVEAKLNAIAYKQEVMFQVLLFAAAFYLFCLLFIWNRPVVEDGTIVFRNGIVLYPGTRFTLYPFINHETKVLHEKVDLSYSGLMVDCIDGSYSVGLETSVILEIEEARRIGVSMAEIGAIIEGSKRYVADAFTHLAKSLTVGELVSCNKEPINFYAGSFPATWEGKSTVSISS